LVTIDRQNREYDSNDEKISSLKSQVKDLQKEIVGLELELNEKLEFYKQEKDGFQKLESAYQETVKNLD